MTGQPAPHTRREQFQFLRDAHHGPLVWKGLCLSLARQAPGLPAVYPSALAAAHATPEADRVYRVRDLRRGMVAYFDNPTDSNPYAHIVTVAGWEGCPLCFNGKAADDLEHEDPHHTGQLADLLVWTNDAARTGGVDLVHASFFPGTSLGWGDPFLFGATSLNGYTLPGYGTPTQKPATLGEAFDQAIAQVRKAIRHHRRRQGEDPTPRRAALIRALTVDLAEMKETRKRFSG